MDTLLRADRLDRRFGGVIVLRQACLELRAGESVGLVGQNGTGKTSLLNILSGIDRGHQGRVYFAADGGRLTDVTRWSVWLRARAGLLYYFQDPHVWHNLTLREHLLLTAVGPGLHGSVLASLSWAARPGLRGRVRARADELLELIGLRERADDLAGELSYGQMKLLALARLLALPAPKLLLLDEPTAGVAPPLIPCLLGLLYKARKSGVCLLVVEHDRELLASLTGRVLELDGGQLRGGK